MEQNKNLSSEPSKTISNNPTGSTGGRANSPIGTTGATPASQTPGTETPTPAASATQRALEGAQSAYEDTKQVVSDAYGKTSEVLTNTYDQAMVYGRENPGKLTLIAFGAGIGIGVLLSAGFGGRSRTSRIAEPIVGALSQVVMEFLR